MGGGLKFGGRFTAELGYSANDIELREAAGLALGKPRKEIFAKEHPVLTSAIIAGAVGALGYAAAIAGRILRRR